MAETLSEQEAHRRTSLQKIRDLGIEPFPAAEFPVTATSADITAFFKDDAPPRDVVIAGRVMNVRVMGKAAFAVLRDGEGDQQIYITRDDIAPGEDKAMYNEFFKKLLDLGDFIGVKGFVFRTRTGEITVHVKEMTMPSRTPSSATACATSTSS